MKPAKSRWLPVLCVAALALGGCAARVQMINPVATADRPRVVELYVASMIQTRTHYIADGTFVAREEYPPQSHYTGRYDDLPTVQVRTKPSPAQWKAFWRVADRLRLDAWKSTYAQSDMPPDRDGSHIYQTDGADWTMRLATPGHEQIAKGDGAYPVAGQPARTTISFQPPARNGMLTLENAFAELTK